MANPNLYRAKIIKRLLTLLLIPLVLTLGVIRPGTAATAKHYTELKFPPLAEVQIPDYQRFQLDNGLTVYLMEDHELPLVSGQMLIRTGQRFDPEAKVGLADIMGEVMRTGGTQRYSPDQLNQELEQRAAAVEVSVNTADGNASFSALSEDVEAVFSLFADVLREPRFAQEQLDLAKTQRQGAIARRNDDPGDIGSREFRKLVYGPTSPYARTQEYSTLDNISRADVLQVYQHSIHPNRMILGLVGDFDPKAMTALIQAKFGNWPAGPADRDPVPTASQTQAGGLFLVNQPQLTQSTVQIGHIGGQLDSPDVFALLVMNEVLNGFGGRLFDEVRSRQGLAYSVYAVWRAQYDYPGLFFAGGQTRSETTVPFIKAVHNELQSIRTTPISAQELAEAQDSILNSFVFNFQDPAQILTRLLRYDYYGYPEDYLFRYQRAVKTMDPDQVQAAARQSLRPDQLITLVVGDSASIQPPLESLQTPVTAVDITIPVPGSKSS